MKTQTKHSLMLMLCAFIWGTAFVAQSAGSGMGAYSFLAGRSWLAVLVLIPTVFAFDAVRKKQGQPYGWPKEKSERPLFISEPFLFSQTTRERRQRREEGSEFVEGATGRVDQEDGGEGELVAVPASAEDDYDAKENESLR